MISTYNLFEQVEISKNKNTETTKIEKPGTNLKAVRIVRRIPTKKIQKNSAQKK